MNILVTRSRLIGAASLAVLVAIGCGPGESGKGPKAAGNKKVTLHIKDMQDQLGLE